MSRNPLFNRNTIGKSGRVAERLASKRVGGTLTPASGASASKGDYRLQGNKSDFMMEVKSTTLDSISVKAEWLVKLKDEANINGQTPALTLVFVNEQGVLKRAGSWVLVQEHVFLDLVD